MTAHAEALSVAEAVLEFLQPVVTRAVIAGSLRRMKPEVKDIEIVAEPAWTNPDFFGAVEPDISNVQRIAQTMGPTPKCGTRYVQVEDVLGSGITLDLFLVHPPAEFGAILAIRTGPADFSQALVTRLRGRLWRCEEGRVLDDRSQLVPTPTEEDFFAAARVPYLEPSQRTVENLPRSRAS